MKTSCVLHRLNRHYEVLMKRLGEKDLKIYDWDQAVLNQMFFYVFIW